MAMNKRERTLLITTISLTVIGVNYLLISPLNKRWTTLQNDLLNKRRELKDEEAFISRAPQWQKDLDTLRKKVGQESTRFQQPSDVLNTIESIKDPSGVVIKDRRPMNAVEREGYRELPVSCSFDATTESLVKFLDGIQSSPEPMSVEELQVTPQPDNTALLRCTIRIQATISKTGGTRS